MSGFEFFCIILIFKISFRDLVLTGLFHYIKAEMDIKVIWLL